MRIICVWILADSALPGYFLIQVPSKTPSYPTWCSTRWSFGIDNVTTRRRAWHDLQCSHHMSHTLDSNSSGNRAKLYRNTRAGPEHAQVPCTSDSVEPRIDTPVAS